MSAEVTPSVVPGHREILIGMTQTAVPYPFLEFVSWTNGRRKAEHRINMTRAVINNIEPVLTRWIKYNRALGIHYTEL